MKKCSLQTLIKMINNNLVNMYMYIQYIAEYRKVSTTQATVN